MPEGIDLGLSYQDVEIEGAKGSRECASRWEIIKPYLQDKQTVVDVGSNLGYFSLKIAKEFPESFVWSIENNWADRQKEILSNNDIKNIALSNITFNLPFVSHLSRTCEPIDVFLLLSVIQYHPLVDIPEILWSIARIAHTLIIEPPLPEEESSLKGFDLERLLKTMFESVKIIGTTQSLGNQTRNIYLCKNSKVNRHGVNASMYSLSTRQHVIAYDGKWTIDNKSDIIPGINLGNLLCCNTIYPEDQLENAAHAYEHLTGATDVNPFNVVFNGDYNIIDYKENGEPASGDIKEYLQNQMKKVIIWR